MTRPSAPSRVRCATATLESGNKLWPSSHGSGQHELDRGDDRQRDPQRCGRFRGGRRDLAWFGLDATGVVGATTTWAPARVDARRVLARRCELSPESEASTASARSHDMIELLMRKPPRRHRRAALRSPCGRDGAGSAQCRSARRGAPRPRRSRTRAARTGRRPRVAAPGAGRAGRTDRGACPGCSARSGRSAVGCAGDRAARSITQFRQIRMSQPSNEPFARNVSRYFQARRNVSCTASSAVQASGAVARAYAATGEAWTRSSWANRRSLINGPSLAIGGDPTWSPGGIQVSRTFGNSRAPMPVFKLEDADGVWRRTLALEREAPA